MKLYNEEQIRKVLHPDLFHLILPQMQSIELPNDEDIEKYNDGSTKLNPRTYYDAFQDGAKWMKEQILNQNL